MRFFLCILLSLWTVAIGAADFSAELLSGEVNVKLQADAERIDLARDLTVRIVIDYPDGVAVQLPDLRDRFSGFATAEDFVSGPVSAGGSTRLVSTWRLVPEPGAIRYRLAPFALSIEDSRISPKSVRTIATKPLLFPPPSDAGPVTGAPEADSTPISIPPTAKEIAFWFLWLVAGAIAITGLFFISRKIKKSVKLLRLSPSQRAMMELEHLVELDLPGKGLFKTFYVELTQVVRRYVERVSGIKAPTMTTEEFLGAVSKNTTVFESRKTEMARFLRSADMIKFAGVEATRAMADSAVDDARGFIGPLCAEGKDER